MLARSPPCSNPAAEAEIQQQSPCSAFLLVQDPRAKQQPSGLIACLAPQGRPVQIPLRTMSLHIPLRRRKYSSRPLVRHSYRSRTRGLSNSNGLRLLIFPQPFGRALKNQNAAPTTPPCFSRRLRSSLLLRTDCLPCFARPPCSNPAAEMKKDQTDFYPSGLFWSEQRDLNPRPLRPELCFLCSATFSFVHHRQYNNTIHRSIFAFRFHFRSDVFMCF